MVAEAWRAAAHAACHLANIAWAGAGRIHHREEIGSRRGAHGFRGGGGTGLRANALHDLCQLKCHGCSAVMLRVVPKWRTPSMEESETRHPLLVPALDEAKLLASRGWQQPEAGTIAEASRLLVLLAADGWRAPEVLVEPEGAIAFEWDAGARGWLRLSVRGQGRVEHSAVIEGDEYAQGEDLAEQLPGWVSALLVRLLRTGH